MLADLTAMNRLCISIIKSTRLDSKESLHFRLMASSSTSCRIGKALSADPEIKTFMSAVAYQHRMIGEHPNACLHRYQARSLILRRRSHWMATLSISSG